MTDHAELFRKMTLVLNDDRFDLMPEVYTYDYVDEYPQSGEVIRGTKNLRSILENYPGRQATAGLRGDLDSMRIQAADGYKAVAPAFTLVRIEKTGDSGVSTIRALYPDGSYWWIILVYTLRGGRIASSRTFFAPDFPAPDWRTQWTERKSAG
jgi:hypothetical protein